MIIKNFRKKKDSIISEYILVKYNGTITMHPVRRYYKLPKPQKHVEGRE